MSATPKPDTSIEQHARQAVVAHMPPIGIVAPDHTPPIAIVASLLEAVCITSMAIGQADIERLVALSVIDRPLPAGVIEAFVVFRRELARIYQEEHQP